MVIYKQMVMKIYSTAFGLHGKKAMSTTNWNNSEIPFASEYRLSCRRIFFIKYYQYYPNKNKYLQTKMLYQR